MQRQGPKLAVPDRRAEARTREVELEVELELVQASCPGARDGTVTAMEGAATTMAWALAADSRQGERSRMIGILRLVMAMEESERSLSKG